MNSHHACIVQRDFTILLETAHPQSEKARELILPFAELTKSPPAFHTYKITPLTLWSAAALGYSADEILSRLESVSRWNVPASLTQEIRQLIEKYGKLTLQADARSEDFRLVSEDTDLIGEILAHPSLTAYELSRLSDTELKVLGKYRGLLKQDLRGSVTR